MFNRNTDLSAYGFDGSDEFLRRFRNFIGRFAAARQGSAGTDSDAAGCIHLPALSTLTPPVGMSGACGKGPWMAFMGVCQPLHPGRS